MEDELSDFESEGGSSSEFEGDINLLSIILLSSSFICLTACLKHEQQCFISFRPDKTLAASFLDGFKNIPGKACVKRVHNNDAFVNVGN